MSVGSAIIWIQLNLERKIMAHNLETNGNDVAFALRGTPAWHNLANRIFSQDEEQQQLLHNWNSSASTNNTPFKSTPLKDIHTPNSYKNTPISSASNVTSSAASISSNVNGHTPISRNSFQPQNQSSSKRTPPTSA